MAGRRPGWVGRPSCRTLLLFDGRPRTVPALGWGWPWWSGPGCCPPLVIHKVLMLSRRPRRGRPGGRGADKAPYRSSPPAGGWAGPPRRSQRWAAPGPEGGGRAGGAGTVWGRGWGRSKCFWGGCGWARRRRNGGPGRWSVAGPQSPATRPANRLERSGLRRGSGGERVARWKGLALEDGLGLRVAEIRCFWEGRAGDWARRRRAEDRVGGGGRAAASGGVTGVRPSARTPRRQRSGDADRRSTARSLRPPGRRRGLFRDCE